MGITNIPILQTRKQRHRERLLDLLKVTQPEVIEPGLDSDVPVLES